MINKLFTLGQNAKGYGSCNNCGYFIDDIPVTGEVLPNGNGGYLFPIVQPFNCPNCNKSLINVERTNPETRKMIIPNKIEITVNKENDDTH